MRHDRQPVVLAHWGESPRGLPPLMFIPLLACVTRTALLMTSPVEHTMLFSSAMIRVSPKSSGNNKEGPEKKRKQKQKQKQTKKPNIPPTPKNQGWFLRGRDLGQVSSWEDLRRYLFLHFHLGSLNRRGDRLSTGQHQDPPQRCNPQCFPLNRLRFLGYVKDPSFPEDCAECRKS